MSSDLEPSLKYALDQFTQWRATRIKRGKMPEELKALLPPLLKTHKMGRLSKILRIDHNTLKHLGQIYRPESKHSKIRPKLGMFTECILPAVSAEGCRLEFSRPNGQPVKISGLTTESLRSLVTLLMEV
jgi:hypothetical protein